MTKNLGHPSDHLGWISRSPGWIIGCLGRPVILEAGHTAPLQHRPPPHCPPIQGSDQFMNWIGIDNQFNSIQHELNWNWIERFWIGIELELKTWTDRNWSIQSIHFQFNSSFYKVKHFLYAILWKLQCDKQPHVSKHTRMLHCVFPVWGLQGSLDIKGWPLHQLFWDISSALTH